MLKNNRVIKWSLLRDMGLVKATEDFHEKGEAKKLVAQKFWKVPGNGGLNYTNYFNEVWKQAKK